MGDAYASHSEAATTSVVARVSRAGFSQRSRHGCLYSYGGAPL